MTSKKISVSLILLLSFAFIRPLSLAFEDFAGVPVQKIFPVIISYLLLVTVGLNLRRLKWDLVSVSIFLFCFYAIFSILWGTQIEDLARFSLPFIVFFAVRLYAKDKKDINVLLIALIIGYIIPIVGSSVMIIKGTSVSKIEYYSGITRYQGLFPNVHPFAHAMTFFSFIACLFFQQNKIVSKMGKYGLTFLLVLSTFCLYKTNVRSAYVGFIIFWFFVFLGINKKHSIVFIIVILSLIALNSEKVENIFWKGKAHKLERTLVGASSGRLNIWTHNLYVYSQLNIGRKILGLGIGVETENFVGGKNKVWASHNDFLSLLMTLGLIGLIGYLLILIVLLRSVYTSRVEKRIKFIFIGVLFSFFIVNFVTNGYVFRIEMSQMFWFFMGIYFRINELNDNNEPNTRETNKYLGN